MKLHVENDKLRLCIPMELDDKPSILVLEELGSTSLQALHRLYNKHQVLGPLIQTMLTHAAQANIEPTDDNPAEYSTTTDLTGPLKLTWWLEEPSTYEPTVHLH